VDQPIHIVDMYPTLARLTGTPLGKNKPLDGMDVWPTRGEGKPSPRKEVLYDIEPFRAAVRKGDWKLVWQATLPSQVELFNLAQDPGETTSLADKNRQEVVELQQRIEALAREAVPHGSAGRGEARAIGGGRLPRRGDGSRTAAVTRFFRMLQTRADEPERMTGGPELWSASPERPAKRMQLTALRAAPDARSVRLLRGALPLYSHVRS